MNTLMKRCAAVAVAGLLSCSFSTLSLAEETKAASLNELMTLIRSSQLTESKEHKSREKTFKAEKNQQAALLAKAKKQRASLEARSVAMEKQYAIQEAKVADKQEVLNERLGSLKELFGHLTTAAGDLRANLETSVVSAQYPGREEFINVLIEKMSGSTQLPKLAEIERVWSETLNEIVEGGKVVKFTANVIEPDGSQSSKEVVRVGNYNLVSNGQYLSFSGETGKLSVLARQPSGSLLSGAAALQSSDSGFTSFGVDPTGPAGGSFMLALLNSPNLIERWHQGGIVGYFISGLLVVAFILAAIRWSVLAGMSSKVKAQLQSKKANDNNPLGRVLLVAESNSGTDLESLELKMAEAMLKERPGIESGLNWLKLIAMLGPLLGLLGTVTGMIMTFQAITIFGAGDPKAMAGGISGALVTTVLGLLVAIPVTLLHTYVNGKAKNILHVIEEQSAGIIAENSEK